MEGNDSYLVKLKPSCFHPLHILLQSALATLVCFCHNDGLLKGINEQQSKDSMLQQACADNSKYGSASPAKQCCQVAKMTILFAPFIHSAKQLSCSADWFLTVLLLRDISYFLPLQAFAVVWQMLF